MKKLAIALLLFCAVLTYAMESIPLNLKSWSFAGGPGATKIGNGVVELALNDGAKRDFIAVSAKNPAAGEGYYVLRGQVKASDGGVGRASIVSRTAENGWLNNWVSPDFSASDWQDFELRFYIDDNAKFIELNLTVAKGKVAFRYLGVEKTDCVEGISDNAPDMELWINMDYNDNVLYSENLGGLKNYDEQAIIDYFKLCHERGVTGVLWRVSVMGQMDYYTKVGTVIGTGYSPLSKGDLKDLEVMEQFDHVAVAIREAHKYGIQVYIWMTLCDEAYKDDNGQLIHHNMFLEEHPECKLMNRKGEKLDGTICYSEKAARDYRLALVKELLEYGADGLYLCNRTHSTVFGVDNDCDYAFNPSIVAEYKKRYGVDILTEDFDKAKLQALRAEGYDQLIHDAAELIHAAGQKLMLGVSFWGISTGRVGGNYGKMPASVTKYISEGWVDSIVSGQNNVGPAFGSIEYAAFKRHARPGQKFYYWAQMVDYAGHRVYPVEDLIKQAKFFKFFGANGGMYHESVNFEERDAPEKYFKPMAKFYEEN